LTTDVATNGFTPYTISFTATGSDTDGTISKISFNFGDTAQDLTTGGGIGTSSVSAQMMHVYVTPGIYTAYALLTDSTNDVSAQQTNCTQTITIAASQSAEITSTPVPTGDNKAIFSFGALGIIITIIGGALLLL
jgi:PKD repeat protein